MSNKYIGQLGEELALNFLIDKGYSLVEQNYSKLPYGEIDLVLKKGNEIYFIEVKSTEIRVGDGSSIYPKEHLHSQKINKFKRVVRVYLKEKNLLSVNFYLMAVLVYINQNNKTAKVRIINDFNF